MRDRRLGFGDDAVIALGLAQLDRLETEFDPTGAAVREIQETSTFYSPRTAVTGVPWYLNYSGSGQKRPPRPLPARTTAASR